MSPFEIQEEAYRAFSRWCDDHNADGEMDVLEAAVAYSIWAHHNDITPYLDPPVSSKKQVSE